MSLLRDNAAVLLLAGAALAWYVSSHAAAGALAGTRLALGKRISGHWLPIFIMVVLASILGYYDVAVAVIFATAVAALSLVLGIVTSTHDFAAPSAAPGGFGVLESERANVQSIAGTARESLDAHWRRVWAFVLPAALLALLAGFKGVLNLNHALVFIVEGIVILALWTARGSKASANGGSPAGTPAVGRVLEFSFAIGLAILAAWAGLRAASDISRQLGLISAGFVTSLLVAPALVLPMIGTGMNLARDNLYHAAVTSCVAVVLLNLCLALPVVILIGESKPHWTSGVDRLVAAVSAPQPATAPIDVPEETAAQDAVAIRFPLAAWRVDTVILIVLGLVLLPLAIGRWLPGRFDGMLLILVYVIYMGLTTFAARA